MIKCLSIQQPWATLCIGYFHRQRYWMKPSERKDIENRNWKGAPRYRGDLYIHASKTFDREGLGEAQKILEKMGSGINLPMHEARYLRGGLIGKVFLNDVVKYSDSPWFFGELGFKFRQPEPIEFIPCRGNLGLFELDYTMNDITFIEK